MKRFDILLLCFGKFMFRDNVQVNFHFIYTSSNLRVSVINNVIVIFAKTEEVTDSHFASYEDELSKIDLKYIEIRFYFEV